MDANSRPLAICSDTNGGSQALQASLHAPSAEQSLRGQQHETVGDWEHVTYGEAAGKVGQKERGMQETIEHYTDKLECLGGLVKTTEGRRLAKGSSYLGRGEVRMTLEAA
jgi:hypothetical protein